MGIVARIYLVLFVLVPCACGGAEISSNARDGGNADRAAGGSGSSSGPPTSDSALDASASDAPSVGDAGDGSNALDATCGPSNCPDGCCAGDPLHPSNICITRQSDETCGTGGDLCVYCGATNESCHNGACISVDPGCNPKTCHGCCLDSNTCASGDTNSACGFNGVACQQCGPGMVCNWTPETLDAGVCQPPAQICGPANCAGCCIGTTQGSVCAIGTQSLACGAGGIGCSMCASSGAACVDGECQTPDAGAGHPQICGPSNCPGCCIGIQQGYVCAVGNQSDACGMGGLGCSVCTGEVCVNGKCQP